MFVFTDVPVWLKSLRLHKYAYLFQQLTYEEMMTLTEDWLEQQVRFPQPQYTFAKSRLFGDRTPMGNTK